MRIILAHAKSEALDDNLLRKLADCTLRENGRSQERYLDLIDARKANYNNTTLKELQIAYAVYSGQIIGQAIVSTTGSWSGRCELDVFVLPEYRRAGLGKVLLNHLVYNFKLNEKTIRPDPHDHASFAFYKSCLMDKDIVKLLVPSSITKIESGMT